MGIRELFGRSSSGPASVVPKVQTRPAAEVLFWCINDKCPDSLLPKRFEQLALGCDSCNPPVRFADWKHDADLRTRLKDLAEGTVHGMRPLCPTDNLPMVERCATCNFPIGGGAGTPPIGIWAASSAGKTVFCAGLRIQAKSQLHARAGITQAPIFRRSDYDQAVVEPLLLQGILPDKTKPGEHHSLALRMGRSDWFRTPRTLVFTDMSGELFRNLGDAGDSKDGWKIQQRAHMLLARQAVFLANPESIPGFAEKIPFDPFPVVMALLTTIEAVPDGQKYIEKLRRLSGSAELVAHVRGVLKAYSYFPGDNGERPLYADVANALLGVDGFSPTERQRLSLTLAERLNIAVAQTRSSGTVVEQLDDLAQFLRSNGAATDQQGKLDLDLAIVIPKADLLDGFPDWFETPDMQSAAYPETAGLSRASTEAQWVRALDLASARCRRVLETQGHPEIIEMIDKLGKEFRSVGFFFASAQGREAEPIVEVSVAAERPSPVATVAEFNPAAVAMTPAAQPRAARVGWEVKKKVVEDVSGLRGSQPWGTLEPLLWLLTRN